MERRSPAALVAALLLVTVPAVAHEEHALHALTVIEAVEPSIDGLEVRLVHLDSPALVVRNETDQVLTVLGTSGEPYLQIGSAGVRANAESPTTYISSAPRASAVPRGLRVTGPPRWIAFSDEATWTWFDPRLRFEPDRTQWVVPMELGNQRIVVRGGFESLHGHGHFITQMDAPEVPGLELRLTQGQIPAIFARNETGRVLAVPGDLGEPFLLIGPSGVRANLRSPTYYTSGATAIMKVPPRADPRAAPQWKRVSSQPVWAWLERRATLPAELQQREQLGSTRRTVLEWETRYALGGEPLAVSGIVEWIPPVRSLSASQADPDTPWLIVAGSGLAGIAVIIGLMLMVRARRGAP